MLSTRVILRYSSRISAANFLGLALSIPTSVIVVRVLGPELYGIAGIVLLWQFYADLFRPGLATALMREVPPLIESGERGKAERIKNAALSGELAYGLVACVVLLVASFAIDDARIALGVRMSSAVFAATHVYQLLLALQWAHKEFHSLSRVSLYHRTISSLALLALLWYIGPYSLVVAPGIAALVGVALILWSAPPRSLRPAWDTPEIRRLMSVGLALMLFSFFLQGFKILDRTAIAGWMSPAELGLYAFALNFVNVAIIAFTDFGGVMQPIVWGKLGEHGRISDVSESVQKVAVLLGLVSCASATLSQAVFGAFIHFVVPKFADSVPVFEWLVFLIPLYTATMLPSMLLVSRLLNKHSVNAGIWGAGLILKGLIFAALVRGLQLGLVSLAIGAVVAQLLVVIALFAAVQRDLFVEGAHRRRFYGWLAWIAAVGLGAGLLLRAPATAFDPRRPVATIVLRLGIAVAVWAFVGLLMRASWFPSWKLRAAT